MNTAVKVIEREEDSLTESFLQYFTIDLATTPAQKKSVYKIRYRVYCEEFGYEPAHRFPEKMEYDAYDDHSLHCLITNISSGKSAGCVRLIQTTDNRTNDFLPFEKSCAESLDTEFIRGLNLDRKRVCEISRLAVDAAFRRRAGEARTRFGDVDALNFTHQERRTFALIAVAGFLAATALSDLACRTNVFAMMEPFLPRLLKRSGIIFQKVGKDIEYHGLRAPYFIRTQSALDNMRPDLKDMYEAIYEKIKLSFAEQATTAN
jgi:N-acyl amino acid synthase of PEP-CTERM/exosortase system